jgi:hypothetical protein
VVEVEKHVLETVRRIPRLELPQLAAELLQRVIALDGTAFVANLFPLVGEYWVDPKNDWNPNE